MRQQAFDLGKDLLVAELASGDSPRRTGSDCLVAPEPHAFPGPLSPSHFPYNQR